MSDDSRAVSPVVSTILMVAVVVVLAATISVLVLDFGEETTDAGPVVGQSSGDFEAFDGGNDDAIVTIRHVAGDTIQTENIEVAVDATDTCTKKSRLVNLPVDGSYGNAIGNENIQGDNIFDQRAPYLRGGTELGSLAAENYTAGDIIQFRIPDKKCTVNVGDTVTVRVVHTPTNSVVIKKELDAE